MVFCSVVCGFCGFTLTGYPAQTHARRSASLWSWFILGIFSPALTK